MHDLWMVALLIICAIPANGYVFLYIQRNWWATEPGRAIMVKSLANMGLVNLGLAAWVWPDYPGRSIFRLVVFVLFAAGLWYLFIALLRTPKSERIPWREAWQSRRARRNGR